MVEIFKGLASYCSELVDFLITVLVVVVVVIVLLRLALVWLFPFGWLTSQVRQVTDLLIWPISQALPVPNSQGIASIIAILITLIGAHFFKQIFQKLLLALVGLVEGVGDGSPTQILGWILYGAVSVLLLMIFLRIVLSWIPFARDSKLAWSLFSLTEPIMSPFRQLIPPLGMFDLSPIILIFLLSFVENAILNLLIQ